MAFKHACSMCSLAWCLMQHTPVCITCRHSRSTQITGMVTSIVVLVRTTATAIVSLVKRILFLLFWKRQQNRQRALRDFTCGLLVVTMDEAYQWLVVKAAVRCLLLTTNEAGNKHHTLAKSLLMFETSTQKTNRRHTSPFPNTNEVECMPATSLHDLLDSMHNTLSQLQIAAGRACDVLYSLIRVSSPWPVLLAMPIPTLLRAPCRVFVNFWPNENIWLIECPVMTRYLAKSCLSICLHKMLLRESVQRLLKMYLIVSLFEIKKSIYWYVKTGLCVVGRSFFFSSTTSSMAFGLALQSSNHWATIARNMTGWPASRQAKIFMKFVLNSIKIAFQPVRASGERNSACFRTGTVKC